MAAAQEISGSSRRAVTATAMVVRATATRTSEETGTQACRRSRNDASYAASSSTGATNRARINSGGRSSRGAPGMTASSAPPRASKVGYGIARRRAKPDRTVAPSRSASMASNTCIRPRVPGSSPSSSHGTRLPKSVAPASPPPFSAHHALHEGGRCYDRDIAKGIERQQIAVAADDQIGAAAHRQLQKFVIMRIAAGRNALSDGDQLGARQHFHQISAKAGGSYRRYIRARQYGLDFLLGSVGFQEDAVPVDPPHGMEWQGIGFEDRADDDVSIENDPHPSCGATSF